MKKIPLTKNLFALVDDGDFEYLNQWKWHAQPNSNTFYAARTKIVRNNDAIERPTILMHREILRPKAGKFTDHVDGNGLDNCRDNLRECSRSENARNKGKQANAFSKYKGVSWHMRQKKWNARITVNGKTISLGSFENEKDAALAYDKAAKTLHGVFCQLNIT